MTNSGEYKTLIDNFKGDSSSDQSIRYYAFKRQDTHNYPDLPKPLILSW
jgi:hypothetical protein